MIINNLTKNFSFLESDKFIIDKKNEIISFIQKAEDPKGEPNYCITEIQKALECVIIVLFYIIIF